MGMTLVELLEAEKDVNPLPSWRPVDPRGKFRWRAEISVNGATVEGLILHGRALAAEPGREVSFTLEHAPAGAPSSRIDRIDWKPLTPHSNKGIGRQEIRFEIYAGSNRHLYYENLTQEGNLRAGNLPVAVHIESALPTFDALIAFVAQTYKIPRLALLPPPPWIEDLFQ